MEHEVKKNFIGDVNIGDKLILLPHRLLSLGKDKIAIIAENSNGWGITDINDYLNIRNLFPPPGIVFANNLGTKKTTLIKSLWDFNLLKKNDSCLGELVQPFAPILLVLKITGNCNFNCAYCYDHSKTRIDTIIPIDKVKTTITTILAKNRGINLVFHGGEPLLHFPLIREIVTFAVQATRGFKQINFFIQTNGSLFNREIIDFLDKYNFFVGVSLDGMTESTNAHRTVKSVATCLEFFNKNIKEYGEFYRRRVGIICTLSKLNLAAAPNFIFWLQNLGIKSIALNPLMLSGKAKQLSNNVVATEELLELFSNLITLVKNNKLEHISLENINKFISSLVRLRANDLCHANPCGAGYNFLVIDSQGNYRACDCIYDNYFLLDNNANNCISDARTKILQRREYMKNHACSTCAIFGFCGGGCIAAALANTGTDKAFAESNCKIKKFFYKTLLQEYAFDKERPLFTYYSQITGAKNRHNNKTTI